MFRAPSTARRRVLASLLALSIGSGVLATSASTAAAENNASISIQPITEGSGIRRAAFVFSMAAGTVQTDSVVVTNNGDETVNVRVYIANAFSTASGKIGVKAYTDELTTPATWLRYTSQLGDGILQIAPHTAKSVPFAIRVPADAGPGDYAIGLGAMPVVDDAPTVPGQDTITIITAVATLALIRVDGPLLPSVAITDMKVSAKPPMIPGTAGGQSTVDFNLVNSGNQRVKATVNIAQVNALGRVSYRYPAFTIEGLLPGAVVPIKKGWPDAPVLRGRIKVEVTTDSDAKVTRSMGFWSIPWGFIALLVVVIVLLVLLLRYRRRRRARMATTTSVGGAPTVRVG
jgi:uncharacterized membrane protein